MNAAGGISTPNLSVMNAVSMLSLVNAAPMMGPYASLASSSSSVVGTPLPPQAASGISTPNLPNADEDDSAKQGTQDMNSGDEVVKILYFNLNCVKMNTFEQITNEISTSNFDIVCLLEIKNPSFEKYFRAKQSNFHPHITSKGTVGIFVNKHATYKILDMGDNMIFMNFKKKIK